MVGGDQLTRVRLTSVKNVRLLAPDPRKRFSYVDPIVFELWHVKQDFLEVCIIIYSNSSEKLGIQIIWGFKSIYVAQ